MQSNLEKTCREKGVKMTEQRRVIIDVIANSNDHPNVDDIHSRAIKRDKNISITTIYRTVKMLEELSLINKHDFMLDDKARYETIDSSHHDHMVDVTTGNVIEFMNEEIEAIQHKIAKEMGYELVDHKLELYVRPISKK